MGGQDLDFLDLKKLDFSGLNSLERSFLFNFLVKKMDNSEYGFIDSTLIVLSALLEEYKAEERRMSFSDFVYEKKCRLFRLLSANESVIDLYSTLEELDYFFYASNCRFAFGKSFLAN